MPYIQTSASSIVPAASLYYEDTLHGKPVLFIHGWPLSSAQWEYQFNILPRYGLRCIAYDRRGFGRSDKPWGNYDYNTLADDLKAVIDGLNLEKVTLVGFSMGGGEVARYIGKYGTARIDRVVLISSVVPFMLKTADNPDGTPQEVFDGFLDKIAEDRPGFMADFGKLFYGVSFLNKAVSTAFLDNNLTITMQASPKATSDCVRAFAATDFRRDLSRFDIPTLLIHGDSDKIVPIEGSSKKAVEMISGASLTVYEGEPHGLFYTQKDRLNQDLLHFTGVTNAPQTTAGATADTATDETLIYRDPVWENPNPSAFPGL